MKKYCLIGLLLTMACGPMQSVVFTEPEYHVEVFEVDGERAQLFLKAHNWLVKIFTDAESVIQHSDKDEGVILGKYLMFGEHKSAGYGIMLDSRVYAVIDIRVKDQKGRIEVRPQGNWQYQQGTIYGYTKQNALDDMKKMAESFHVALLKKDIEF